MPRPLLLVPALMAGGLLIAACGGGSSSSSSASGSAAGSSSAAAATTSNSSGGGAYSYKGSGTSVSASSASGGTVITTKHSKYGTILAAGSKKLTAYLFEADKGPASMCTGACAAAWPPVLAKGAPTASSQAVSADLGTITRAGGVKQVTYKGHPLYYFVKDKDDGDAYGAGVKAFGATWYVLAPSGNKVDNS